VQSFLHDRKERTVKDGEVAAPIAMGGLLKLLEDIGRELGGLFSVLMENISTAPERQKEEANYLTLGTAVSLLDELGNELLSDSLAHTGAKRQHQVTIPNCQRVHTQK